MHGGQPTAISTEIRAFHNSKGQAEVDEEGRIIRRGGGNTGKALGGTAAGGLIGGLAGGLKGAAIGAGVGAAASIAIIEIACDSRNPVRSRQRDHTECEVSRWQRAVDSDGRSARFGGRLSADDIGRR